MLADSIESILLLFIQLRTYLQFFLLKKSYLMYFLIYVFINLCILSKIVEYCSYFSLSSVFSYLCILP